LVITYLIASPFITFNQIKFAVVNGNSEKLATYVDFPILRDNLKSQLKQDIQIKKDMRSDGDEFTTDIINDIIDEITTRGIIKVLYGNQNTFSKFQIQDAINYKFINFNKFSITIKDDAELIFFRNGFNWKLNNIIFSNKNVLPCLYYFFICKTMYK
jgi:hypothetical protein